MGRRSFEDIPEMSAEAGPRLGGRGLLADEQIDYWGERFLFYEGARLGITFEEFLAAPEVFIQAASVIAITRLAASERASQGVTFAVFARRESAYA